VRDDEVFEDLGSAIAAVTRVFETARVVSEPPLRETNRSQRDDGFVEVGMGADNLAELAGRLPVAAGVNLGDHVFVPLRHRGRCIRALGAGTPGCRSAWAGARLGMRLVRHDSLWDSGGMPGICCLEPDGGQRGRRRRTVFRQIRHRGG
jgi:hypothetical protein